MTKYYALFHGRIPKKRVIINRAVAKFILRLLECKIYFAYSGTFIPKLSKPGRVIISSATDKEASQRGVIEIEGMRSGELFIEAFFELLWRGASLKEAFIQATVHIEILTHTDIVSANTINFPYLEAITRFAN
ncbi:MAG: hypothetical protein VSS75_032655 [Candidatus Parabeggiatoa sp.]|nr:hypothetical protein [Candidatus Parabeggiatoa sp.]